MWDFWWTNWHWDGFFSYYCGLHLSQVRTGSLNTIQFNFRHLNRRPHTAQTQFDPRTVHVRFLVDKLALGRVFLLLLRFTLVRVILPSSLLRFQVLTRTINERNLETILKKNLLEIGGHWVENCFYVLRL